MNVRLLIFMCLLLGFFAEGYAQDDKKIQDSISREEKQERRELREASKDSTEVYDDIEKYSKKSKVGKRVHSWLFRDPEKKGSSKPDPQDTINFTHYNDRVIRNIEIKTLDPFGYSVNDDDKVPHSWFQKVGNAVHPKTKDFAISKYFLFDEGEAVDTFLINETSRLLRQQSYVRKVKIIPKLIDGDKDSIDVIVKELDSWSMIPKVRVSGSHTKVGIHERNFIGFGHVFDVHYSKRYSDGNTGFETSYKLPNFQNTFVDAVAAYRIDLDHFYDRFVRVNRRFYSSLTRWAGGAFFQERSIERPFPDADNEFEDKTLKYRYQDYWGGYAVPVFGSSRNPEERTNLVFTGRAAIMNYKRQPPEELDPGNYFSDERIFLGGIALSSRRFIEDQFIFRDGPTEDVPIGSYYGFTSGYQRKNHRGRLYLGLQSAFGTYFNWGYLSTSFEVGSFFSSSHAEQGAISFKATYFSNIWDMGKDWKARWFVKPQLVIGLNRQNTFADRLGLNEKPYFRDIHGSEYIDYDDRRRYIDYATGDIEGFDSHVMGTCKYVIDTQMQFYAPWNFMGFRVNPFVHFSFAYVSGKNAGFESDKFYSSFGVGTIIRNDYLVFNSFQLSLAYYPRMPGAGTNVIRTNAYKTEDFGFQSFEASEPRIVIFE